MEYNKKIEETKANIEEYKRISNEIIKCIEKQIELIRKKEVLKTNLGIEKYSKRDRFDSGIFVDLKIQDALNASVEYNKIENELNKTTIERKKLEIEQTYLKMKIDLIIVTYKYEKEKYNI